MNVQGIDFSQLLLRDALDLAILIEEEAHERYEEFADQMDLHHTPEAAAFFRFMSANESKHGTQLLERRIALFGSAPRQVSRAMLWDVEAPDFDQARAFMTARQAMQAALHSEEKAHAFFVAALPQVAKRRWRTRSSSRSSWPSCRLILPAAPTISRTSPRLNESMRSPR